MAQIPGIYVEIKGDATQLRKDMTAAKQIVTESARGMSNALNNALGPDQIKKGTNRLIESLGSLSRATANSSKAFDQLGVDLRDLQKVTGVTGQQFQQLQSKMLQTSAAKAQEKALRDIAQAAGLSNREIQKMGQQFGLSRAQINSVTDSVNKAGQSFNVFGGLVRTALAYFSVDALIGFARGVVDVGIKVDSLERSFTAITGSAQGAAKEFEFLRETASRTGQNFYALTDSYRQLIASTQGTKLAGEETRQVFESMSEAAAVLGLSNQQLELSLKAFTQMAGKGVVQMEELKNQLGDSLPGAVNIAAQAMGVSVKRLMEMSQAGELLAEDLLPKMADQLHKMYGEAANTAALESGIAAVNRFSQAWTDLKANLYDNEVFTTTANYLSWVIEQYNSVLRVDGASKITEELERQGKELARNERLLAIYNSGFADPPKEKVAALTADIEKQKNAIDGLNLKLQQLKDATDPTVQAAIESGQKMADSWIKAEDLKVDAMLRAQKYENSALEEQAKAEERASQKALKAAEDAANKRVELAKSLSDTIAKNAMTETEVQLFELQKQIEAERKIAGESIALQKMVTDAHIREEERLTMLIKAGIDKRSAAEWESLEKLEDGWLAFNEGKADADARAGEQIKDQQKQTTNVMIDEWSNAYSSIQSVVADWVYDFEISTKSVLDIFRRMLAEMLAAIAMSGIKKAFGNLFDGKLETTFFGGLTSGISDALGLEEGEGVASSIAGALGISKLAGGGGAIAGLSAAGAGTIPTIGATTVGGLSASFGAGVPAATTGAEASGSGGVLSALSSAVGSTKAAATIKGWLGIGATGTSGAAGATAAGATGGGYVAGTGAGVGGAAATQSAGGAVSASGLGISGAGVAAFATYATVAAAAIMVAQGIYAKSQRPSAANEIDYAGVLPSNLSSINNRWRSLNETVLASIPGFQQFETAIYDTSNQMLVATGTAGTLAIRYNEAAAAGHQWESVMTAAPEVLLSAMSASEAYTTSIASSGETLGETARIAAINRESLAGLNDMMSQTASAVTTLSDATQVAAKNMAGAASDMMSLLDGARQTMITAGMDGVSYHADGGIIPGFTRMGNHVLGESGPEAIVPLPYGPDSLKLMMEEIRSIKSDKPMVVKVYIGNEELKGQIRVVADSLDADRDPLKRGRRYLG